MSNTIHSSEMEVATKYGSHFPAVLACLAKTKGPVVELGVGHFSTPQLHAFCGAAGRKLISMEDNAEWHDHFFKKYSTENHVFVRSVKDVPKLKYSVAFIDHSPGGENRAEAFRQFLAISEYVVMHDSQKDAENFKAVESMLPLLSWHLCTDYFPHTLVASETLKIPEVLKF
jgi:hypothetical protein